MEGSGRLDATSDTSSDSSGATAELNGHAAPDTYSECASLLTTFVFVLVLG